MQSSLYHTKQRKMTMLKLIIADDERIIRETISTIINWKEYDI